MDPIKIIFFVLGTFAGNEESRIIAEHAAVTVNPIARTIEIRQEGLFAILFTQEDHASLSQELQLLKNDTLWCDELADYPVKSRVFQVHDDGALSVNLKLKYNTDEDLKAYGITLTDDGNLAFTNFPDDNVNTVDGKLEGNYWLFKADQPFSFTQTPHQVLPEQFKPFKKELSGSDIKK